jgi:hypothetical protein
MGSSVELSGGGVVPLGEVVGLFLVVEGFSFPLSFSSSSSLSSSSSFSLSFSSFPLLLLLSFSFSSSLSFLLFPSPSLFVPSSLLFPGLESAVNVLAVGFLSRPSSMSSTVATSSVSSSSLSYPPPLHGNSSGCSFVAFFLLFFLRQSHCRMVSSFYSSGFCSHIVFSSIAKSIWYSEYSVFILCRNLVALTFAAGSVFASSDNRVLTLSQVDLEMIGPTTTKKLDISRSETPLES